MISNEFRKYVTFEILRFIAQYGSKGVSKWSLIADPTVGANYFSCPFQAVLRELRASGYIRSWWNEEEMHYAVTERCRALLESVTRLYEVNRRVYPGTYTE